MIELIPAIDINGGRAVRLHQGDFAQTTLYDADPLDAARRWVAQGATRIHVVDLDGARAGRPVNLPIIAAIVAACTIPVQVGGGVRDAATVAQLLELGVARVILGTAAVQEPALVAQLAAQYGEQIIVGVDARDGLVATAGWLEASAVRASDLVADLGARGVRRFIYTDIARDGTMTAPNYAATAALVQPGGPAIIASGGVGSIAHLRDLLPTGVEAVIIGRALYDGRFTLDTALRALANDSSTQEQHS